MTTPLRQSGPTPPYLREARAGFLQIAESYERLAATVDDIKRERLGTLTHGLVTRRKLPLLGMLVLMVYMSLTIPCICCRHGRIEITIDDARYEAWGMRVDRKAIRRLER